MSLLSKFKKALNIGNDNNSVVLLSHTRKYDDLLPFSTTEKGFQLNKLPKVALIEVLKTMSLSERIKLALTSRRMKTNVTYAKYKLHVLCVYIRDENSKIQLKEENVTLCCGNQNAKSSDGEVFLFNDLKPWVVDSHSSHENIVSVFEKLQDILSYTVFELALDFNETVNTQKVLSTAVLQDYNWIIVYGNTIERRNLDLIVEMNNSKRSVSVRSKSIPIDYKHEDAFKARDIEYKDARWVRLEDLFSLNNIHRVNLGTNNLTTTDFNSFIKFWIESDCDMFEGLKINTSGVCPIALFDDIVMLKTYRLQTPYRLVACNPSKTNRKQPMLGVCKPSKCLSFSTFSPEEIICVNDQFFDFSSEFSILKILNQKRVLEKEVEKLEEQQKPEKRRILLEIQKLLDEVKKKGVVFIDGSPVFRPN